MIRCERNLRMPIYWVLDEKAKVAACLEIREGVREIIREVGLDYWMRVMKEFIEEGRRGQLVMEGGRGGDDDGGAGDPVGQPGRAGQRVLTAHRPAEHVRPRLPNRVQQASNRLRSKLWLPKKTSSKATIVGSE